MIVEIKFAHGEPALFVQSNQDLAIQDTVIFGTAKGLNYGKVLRTFADDAPLEIEGKVMRKANQQDLQTIDRLNQEAQEAKVQVREAVAELGLDMKIIDAAFNLNHGQLFVSFTADQRVDFRELLRILSSTFHARIELRQIGARDAAKVYGGVGPCGRPLCCSEFIYEFPNVSIKMAKNQALSLKQSKLNGLCGRLMCCLTYEDEFYQMAQEKFPDFGQTIVTAEGSARVIGLNILGNKVKLKYEDQIKEVDLAEIEGSHG